ncbi:hypothetical protein [Ensifer sp. 22564]|uniref:hypothetical protein n=1 Tax=Ensifer sp. 22564 TaxID=3453943 RepID=UPI003F855D58
MYLYLLVRKNRPPSPGLAGGGPHEIARYGTASRWRLCQLGILDGEAVVLDDKARSDFGSPRPSKRKVTGSGAVPGPIFDAMQQRTCLD